MSVQGKQVDPTLTPSNFTPTGSDVNGYLEGIDNALARGLTVIRSLADLEAAFPVAGGIHTIDDSAIFDGPVTLAGSDRVVVAAGGSIQATARGSLTGTPGTGLGVLTLNANTIIQGLEVTSAGDNTTACVSIAAGGSGRLIDCTFLGSGPMVDIAGGTDSISIEECIFTRPDALEYGVAILGDRPVSIEGSEINQGAALVNVAFTTSELAVINCDVGTAATCPGVRLGSASLSRSRIESNNINGDAIVADSSTAVVNIGTSLLNDNDIIGALATFSGANNSSFSNSNISNNVAGDGIVSTGAGNLTMAVDEIIGNRITGGAGYLFKMTSTAFSIQRSIIQGNDGAAGMVQHNSGSFETESCVISGNRAGQSGSNPVWVCANGNCNADIVGNLGNVILRIVADTAQSEVASTNITGNRGGKIVEITGSQIAGISGSTISGNEGTVLFDSNASTGTSVLSKCAIDGNRLSSFAFDRNVSSFVSICTITGNCCSDSTFVPAGDPSFTLANYPNCVSRGNLQQTQIEPPLYALVAEFAP